MEGVLGGEEGGGAFSEVEEFVEGAGEEGAVGGELEAPALQLVGVVEEGEVGVGVVEDGVGGASEEFYVGGAL